MNGKWIKVVGIIVGAVFVLLTFVWTFGFAPNRADIQKLDDGKVSKEVYYRDQDTLDGRLERIEKTVDKIYDRLTGGNK